MAAKEKSEKEKPLDRLTAKELREIAKEIPEITGVHGMNKGELVAAIKQARGITDEAVSKSSGEIRDLKKKIRALKLQRQEALEAKDKKTATIYRRRIARLKKKTRRAA